MKRNGILGIENRDGSGSWARSGSIRPDPFFKDLKPKVLDPLDF